MLIYLQSERCLLGSESRISCGGVINFKNETVNLKVRELTLLLFTELCSEEKKDMNDVFFLK